MSAVTLRNAVVDTIQSRLPSLRSCEAHGGRFTAEELRRFLTHSPAVLVACLGAAEVKRSGAVPVATYEMVAVVVARDVPTQGATPGTSRADLGMSLADSVAALVSQERWGAARDRARRVEVRNLYGGPLDKMGAALWAVQWRQEAEFSDDELSAYEHFLPAAEQQAAEAIHLEADLEPADGTPDMEAEADLGAS